MEKDRHIINRVTLQKWERVESIPTIVVIDNNGNEIVLLDRGVFKEELEGELVEVVISGKYRINIDSHGGVLELSMERIGSKSYLVKLNGVAYLLIGKKYSQYDFDRIPDNFPSLQVLELDYPWDSSKSIDNISALSNLPNLTSLNLEYCKKLTELSLSNLPNLRNLSLSACSKLTDISALSNLLNLASLNLSVCHSLTDISALSNLVNLTSLDLSSCSSLTDISALSNLPNLTSLDLSSCSSLTDISALSNLPNLTSLNLEYCEQLTDISALSNLPNLTSLNLEYCEQLTDISSLSNLVHLTSLNLEYCKKLTDISALGNLVNLTSLDLSWCERLTNLSGLGNLVNLTSLNLSNWRKLSDISPLANLVNLISLDLNCDSAREDIETSSSNPIWGSWTKLTDISALSNLVNLRNLSLSACSKLTDISSLSNLPNLTSLDLGWCYSLTDISGLSNLVNLTSLDLESCRKLSDTSALSNLVNLTSLNLSNCRSLTDLSGLGNLVNLTSLNLSVCHSLTDISALSNLVNLTSLNLGWCYSLIELSLSNLPNLTSLDLRSCDELTDVSLSNLPNLTRLDLENCETLTLTGTFYTLKKIRGTSTISSISLHGIFSNLQTLDVSDCKQLQTLTLLGDFGKLKSLDLSSCERLTDISTLSNLANLKELKKPRITLTLEESAKNEYTLTFSGNTNVVVVYNISEGMWSYCLQHELSLEELYWNDAEMLGIDEDDLSEYFEGFCPPWVEMFDMDTTYNGLVAFDFDIELSGPDGDISLDLTNLNHGYVKGKSHSVWLNKESNCFLRQGLDKYEGPIMIGEQTITDTKYTAVIRTSDAFDSSKLELLYINMPGIIAPLLSGVRYDGQLIELEADESNAISDNWGHAVSMYWIRPSGGIPKVTSAYPSSSTGSEIYGKRFFYSGSFEAYREDQLCRVLQSYGGLISEELNKEMDYFVVGKDPDEVLLSKAKGLALEIIGESDLLLMLENEGDETVYDEEKLGFIDEEEEEDYEEEDYDEEEEE